MTDSIYPSVPSSYHPISLPDELLSKLSNAISAQTGLHFSKERWHDLERGICNTARELDFKDVELFVRGLLASTLTKNQIKILARHLTIGETYFFREKAIFEAMERHILPELISRKDTKRLRIWSAGCSTGEEPYSIAIVLYNLMSDLADWQITIQATDINTASLQKASDGIYNNWSFRDTPPDFIERYFKRQKDGRFEIIQPVKRLVTFSYLNLVENDYPSILNNTNAMDIIFCRNTLMYFAPEQVKKILLSLYNSIVDGGWLIVSPIETPIVIDPRFVSIKFTGATLYRKGGALQYDRNMEIGTGRADMREPVAVGDDNKADDEHLVCPDDATTTRPASTDNELYTEALNMYEQGRYEEAVDIILNNALHKGGDTDIILMLARAYANKGDLGEALKWNKKAIEIDKLNPVSHYLNATILQEQGRMEEAAESLKRTIYLDQDFVLAHFMLGNIVWRQGRRKEADKHLKNAVLLLNPHGREDVLPCSEGISAGTLIEIIRSMHSTA